MVINRKDNSCYCQCYSKQEYSQSINIHHSLLLYNDLKKYNNLITHSLYIRLHSHDQYIWHTHFHTSVQCTNSQLSNCHTASTTGLMAKHFYSGTVTKCWPSQCDHILMTCALSNSHQMTGTVYTQITCLRIKNKPWNDK